MKEKVKLSDLTGHKVGKIVIIFSEDKDVTFHPNKDCGLILPLEVLSEDFHRLDGFLKDKLKDVEHTFKEHKDHD